jgi:Acetyltransferases
MSQIQIIKYQDTDFKGIIGLLVNAFESKFLHRQNLNPNDVKHILALTWDISAADTGYLHFIAKEDERVVGTILIQCGKTQKSQKKFPFLSLVRQYGLFNMLFLTFKLSVLEIFKPQDCYIEHIAVDQLMRGKGIGEMLLFHAEETLKDMGFSTLSLAVAKENPAKHLYDRMGFQDINYMNSRFKGFFIGINEWIFMQKTL